MGGRDYLENTGDGIASGVISATARKLIDYPEVK